MLAKLGRQCGSLLGLVVACARCGSTASGVATNGDAAIADAGANDAPARVDGGRVGGGATDAGTVIPDVGTPVATGDAGAVDVTITVDATKPTHAISPLIYGVNDGSKAAGAHATIVRTGGNRLTAFNWENNASNAGSDYEYESDDYLCSNVKCAPSNDAPGAFLAAIAAGAASAGAATLVTIPIVDYVAADKTVSGDIRATGSDYLTKHFKQNVAAKGAAFADPPDSTDAFVYQDELVSWIGAHVTGTTVRYLLDNEPDLWSSTHPEVHPTAVTYAELLSRSIKFATAIKAVAPSAIVAGPASYGWAGYVSLQSASDSAADGDFVEYYLAQLAAAGATAGKRLVDDLDLHWYPEATGDGTRITTATSTPGLVTAREQAPRSLWDASYVEDSWITSSMGGKAIALLPLMLGKIAAKYPGTGLSISEWNYGGGGDVSGAIASADVLGLFGAYGLDMAMMWPMNGDESFTYGAFEVYRNYDGKGAAFGDVSVPATSSDVATATAYASLASSDDTKVVVVVINKALAATKAGVAIKHSKTFTSAKVWTLTQAGGASPVAAPAIGAAGTNAFAYSMPAQSISVLELH